MNKVFMSTVLSAAVLSGCSTVTIEQQGVSALSTTPDYPHNYYFWGLMGEKHINTSEICGGNPVDQMQSQATFTNANRLLYTTWRLLL